VAAAGPDAIIIASTESVRKAFEGPDLGDNNVKPFQPQLKIPMTIRISQVAFSADESYLVLSAEIGGGLAVYDVQALMQGSTQIAFQLSTNGQALRALTPNPTPEKGELFAVVTADGKLMMANLKERTFISRLNQQFLKEGVSCISWSAKGKQLVAGLGNGTAYQMTPEGDGKAEIPRPPDVDAAQHGKFLPHSLRYPMLISKVSSITWLENNVFLTVHTPSTFPPNETPTSSFHLVTKQPPANFIFQTILDPVGSFGLNRNPPHHFLLRLRDFPPNLQDVLIVASSAATDIGLFTRSKVPLTADKPADKVTGVFTMTEFSDDSRRAQLPVTASMNDTSPIGFALDLSSKEKVTAPIKGDEIDESPSPLPALMLLNNEGVLASWWLVYSESIRQGTVYPGLVAGGASLLPAQPSPAPAAAPASAFGGPTKPTFGAPTFGAQNIAPAFGQASAPGTFGAPTGLGQKASVWGAPVATTAPNTGPTFGSISAPNASTAFGTPAFGAVSTPSFGLGNRQSVWGSDGGTAPNAAFGQAGGLGKPASPFGSSPANVSSAAPSGGFATFAQTGGFAAAAAATGSGGSVFGAKPASAPFSNFGSSSPLGSGNTFGGAIKKDDDKPSNSFGSGSFVLGSTFKADPNAKDSDSAPSNEPKGPSFGGGFSGALGEVAKAPVAAVSKETEMDSDDTPQQQPSKIEFTTPASTPAAPKSLFGAPSQNGVGLFGTPPSSTSTTTKPIGATSFSFGQIPTEKPKTSSFSFGNLTENASAGPKTPTPKDDLPSLISSETPLSPKIKQEPIAETPSVTEKIPEAPLPPDPTSKTSYTAGESSSSSAGGDAPLPPDFLPKPVPKAVQPLASPVPQETIEKPMPANLIPPRDVPGGPEDEDDDSEFITEEEGDEQSEEQSEEGSEEGSGEDITKDLSPTSEANQTPGFTPESSFGGLKNRSPQSSNLFSNVSRPGPINPSRSLFGEIGTSAPILAPPNMRTSPRSPSPVRSAVPTRMQHPAAHSSKDQSKHINHSFSQRSISTYQPHRRSTTEPFAIPPRVEDYSIHKVRHIAQKQAAETQALVDEDDERLQNELASEVMGNTKLEEFVAHSDYISDRSMESIPAQVETVYRDINSMIDTLGVNARSLKAFIKGHTEQYKEQGRERDDLEKSDDWVLVEVENLSSLVEKDLSRDLEDCRVKDVAHKLETCNDLQKDLIRLRAKHEDIKKIIDSHQNHDHLAIARAQPLTAEQAAQQHDLRRDFTKFQKLLSEAEEGLTILKARIVSQSTSHGKINGSAGPTVDAIMRTITKMTSMVEKRSGDIDVLEGHMRRLRFSSTASVGSREGSPFATPQNRTSFRNPGTSSTYSLFYTPDSIKDTPQRFQSSLMSSTGSFHQGSPPRKKMSGYTVEEKAQLKTKLARKKDVTNRLRVALQKAGTNIRLMDEE
jgi:nucleoporin NUP159